MTVNIKDIVDALEMQFDEYDNYLDTETGEVYPVSHDALSRAEEPDPEDDPPDEKDPEYATAVLIVETDRFLQLPTKWDVNEWEIMDDFSRAVEDTRIRQELLSAIRGAGAFRYFRDVIHRHGIQQDWYAFRTQALTDI